MENIGARINHDHDYCTTKEKEVDVVDRVAANIVQSSPKSPLCLSPTYSCDSGIDSFACDLSSEFGKEGDDFLNLLLDDDFSLGFEPEKNTRQQGSNGKNSSAIPDPVLSSSSSVTTAITANMDSSELSTIERNRKNAEAARENRKKKKAYITGLEHEVKQLRIEKNVLTEKSKRLERKVGNLEDEVDYLKSILANQSMLSKLLERVAMAPGVSLSTSFCPSRQASQPQAQQDVQTGKENKVSTRSSAKRACISEKSIQINKRIRKNESGGVCLHVKENKVSFEFCHVCSKKAGN